MNAVIVAGIFAESTACIYTSARETLLICR